MEKPIIYVVEDEPNIQKLVQYNLEKNGFSVEVFDQGESLLERCAVALPTLFILDIMLPGMDGFEICKKIRQTETMKAIPIIMLTAKNEEFDRVLGLELGADDYVPKPFSVRELVARVKAVLRRTGLPHTEKTEVLRHNNLTMDTVRHEVYKDDILIDMTYKEFELLKLFMQNKGRVFTRETLLNRVWGYDYYGETRTVDVHVHYLRQKIEEDEKKPTLIQTVRGIGYKFSDRIK